MMSERQRKFREQYKADISPMYNGLLHIGVMYAVGIAAVWYCVTHLQSATWEWLLALPVFIAGNFVEWAMHRFVMHRRIDVFALRAIYERAIATREPLIRDYPDVPDYQLYLAVTLMNWHGGSVERYYEELLR